MADVREWSRSDTARFVRTPTPDDDKYSRGVVALRTGSPAYPGAAVLGVEAAWRAGAGFVRYIGDTRVADAVLARRPETVTGSGTGRTRIGAWVIGSGTDPGERAAEELTALREILAGSVPVVVDAGALDLAQAAAAPLVVTPHAREFARLRERLEITPDTGESTEDAVLRVAHAIDGVVLLKGARTLIGDQTGALVSVAESTGWQSTAGTGDVLAGVLGALIAANPARPLLEVVAAGAWLHGRASRLAAGADDGWPGHPIVALDIVACLPRAIGDLLA